MSLLGLRRIALDFTAQGSGGLAQLQISMRLGFRV